MSRFARVSTWAVRLGILTLITCGALALTWACTAEAKPTTIGNGIITDGGIDMKHNADITMAYGSVRTDGGASFGTLVLVNGPQGLGVGNGHLRTDGGVELHGLPIICSYTDSSGSPGNATINKPCGRSAIAAGASAATITNNLITATSIIDPNPESADATLGTIICVPGAGSMVCTNRAAGAATNVTANTTFTWTVTQVF